MSRFQPRVTPVEELVFRSRLVWIGHFRCPPDSGLFVDSGPASAHLFVFPRTSVRIQHLGDVALIHASFEDTRPDGSHGRGRYTDIWQRRNGRWLCVSAHFTRC